MPHTTRIPCASHVVLHQAGSNTIALRDGPTASDRVSVPIEQWLLNPCWFDDDILCFIIIIVDDYIPNIYWGS